MTTSMEKPSEPQEPNARTPSQPPGAYGHRARAP
ncbi:ABC transporter permease [Streptomyces badius]